MGHRDVTIHMYLLFSHLFFLVMVYFSHGILDNRISFLSFFLSLFFPPCYISHLPKSFLSVDREGLKKEEEEEIGFTSVEQN